VEIKDIIPLEKMPPRNIVRQNFPDIMPLPNLTPSYIYGLAAKKAPECDSSSQVVGWLSLRTG